MGVLVSDFERSKGTPNVPPAQVAFRAQDRTQVDAFREAARRSYLDCLRVRR